MVDRYAKFSTDNLPVAAARIERSQGDNVIAFPTSSLRSKKATAQTEVQAVDAIGGTRRSRTYDLRNKSSTSRPFYAVQLAAEAASSSLSLYLMILPTLFLGNSPTKRTCLGFL